MPFCDWQSIMARFGKRRMTTHIHFVFQNPLKELTTTMTTTFTGRLQFTGKKAGFALLKRCFGLFTLDPGNKTRLLRSII